MINNITMTGRLVADPELRYTNNGGKAVASFRIACDRPSVNSEGKHETDFFTIIVWEKKAEACAQNLKKGRMIALVGRLQNRSYENRESKKVWVTEIVAHDVQFMPDGQGNNTNSGGRSNTSSNQGFDDDPFADDSTSIDISPDDLPF